MFSCISQTYKIYQQMTSWPIRSTMTEEANEALKQYIGIGVGAENAIKAYSEHGVKYEQLSKLGYSNIDAVDASEGLLNVANSKGLYGRIVCQLVGHGQAMPFDDKTYDMVVICGAMGENHIPKAALPDIIRVVKPGGYIVNVFREEALYVPWYEDGLQPYMNKLEEEGLWIEFSRHKFPIFIANKEGLVLVHKVL
ncbi:ubiquinone/menaquinone biosynthesis C-methyltransferase UbiE-like isoform X3 [Biomphalaria glabrata]|uniref:Ubiquinone/menaquinone biosynthesis C-methyltransferase UbiE-like isoform X3 n=2 Tax=Biomphalaria glabrata TaxID=6526 RepID=A0A9U8EKB8_BIOGL|nr:ubiquinone/menaquinone biosynthesis C-methyltransferase UbiE-like isoform X3 [Biomphalaria glabrata]